MNRRVFLKTSAIGGTAMAWGFRNPTEVTHTLTLSFDDGFRKSFFKVADIFEANGLSACFNVIASGQLPGFQRVDDWILPEILGNFDESMNGLIDGLTNSWLPPAGGSSSTYTDSITRDGAP